MASPTNSHPSTVSEPAETREVRVREYQVEMLEESLRANVIVVMPTGTGKTEIAIQRIQNDVYKGDPEKFTWLLCPTVVLCEQHTHTIKNRFPSMWCKGLTSKDGVDHWSEKAIWEKALSGIKIAVSTYQVLYDALSHGFVKMSQLSLLIFDEAHHCTKDHVAKRIMQRFYHEQRLKGDQNLPKILGLTASPILSDLSTLQMVERNLGSICKTPCEHYAQLLQFTNQPRVLLCLPSPISPKSPNEPPLLERLRGIVFSEDRVPVSRQMKSMKSKQISRFIGDSESINRELGIWAATVYMQKSITHFKSNMRTNAEKTNISNRNKEYAMEAIIKLGELQDCITEMQAEDISPMCQCLLNKLLEAYSEDFCGLIFVTRRATVLALKWLIEHHPDTSRRFRCGTFIGMSTTQHSKTELGDLPDIRNQEETLERFRKGILNLIITTDALEEGIDIPACNVVLNFSCSLNLKSFIQRRGRARRMDAKFIIIMEDESSRNHLKQLERMENELIRKFQNPERRQIPALELDRDEDTRSSFCLCIESTGARLTMQDAVSHLYNFCSKLPTQPYVSNNPLFSFEPSDYGRVKAVVRLPSNLDHSLHKFTSSRSWSREKYAKENAALDAYRALYQARLVNEHLLPTQVSDLMDRDFLPRSHYSIQKQLDPWYEISRLWNSDGQLYSHELRILRPKEDEIKFFMIFPTRLDITTRIPLFIDHCTTYTAILTPGHPTTANVVLCQQVTNLIFQSVYRDRYSGGNMDYTFLLVPGTDEEMARDFLERYSGTASLTELLINHVPLSALGLLRNNTKPCRPLVVESWLEGEFFVPGDPQATSSVDAKVKYVTRRRNFLHERQLATEVPRKKCDPRICLDFNIKGLLLREFSVDKLPSMFAQVALLTPSISHEVGVHLIAQQLRQRLFLHSTTAFRRIDLLAIAIRPASIEHQAMFRSLAFIGDAILRYLLAIQLFLHHPLWHEGLLSSLKQLILSDAGLAHAVYQSGLGECLVTSQLNGKRWTPPFVSRVELVTHEANQRHIGAATLADMTKALVGAAFLDNGMDQAASCVSVMVPKIKTWNKSSLSDGTYSRTRPTIAAPQIALRDMEQLIGYDFTDKTLAVEAMTHPSCTGLSETTSYRRLSFLGASVLEWIVVCELNRQDELMNPNRLQSLKSALTNNKFLTFVALTFHQMREHEDVYVDAGKNVHPIVRRCSVSLWNFLRAHSDILSTQLSELIKHSSQEAEVIKRELWEQESYPWVRLSALGDIQVLSDIVQSLFGALFIDSHASLECCEAFAEKLEILPLLKHFVSHEVTTDHPKNTLQGLLLGRKVSYRIWPDREHPQTLRCCVLADGSEIASVEGKTDRGAITVQAAEKAVYLIRKGLANSATP
ncbi:hypothetical protein ASPCADRAFT_518163 [Aspergillus carbonarius ITEM 5010]|uniref:Dicer-like protein 2 n=1 Tax=Aspergillus carbonarius (strain ITEM 5010) TaxID=602072 RepID=A0A1R3RB75_ASPC5|nr:hypothetical protein ASPCADRAFT_518163 [Aspergillus carbonarius ITEM 5010]